MPYLGLFMVKYILINVSLLSHYHGGSSPGSVLENVFAFQIDEYCHHCAKSTARVLNLSFFLCVYGSCRH